MNEVDRVILLATKNFLHNVKQNTPTNDLQLPETEDIKFQRCKKAIYPDGNCLFRAISFCLHKTEEKHTRVRKDVVRYVFEHWDTFKDFLIGSKIYDQDVDNADDYKKYMSGDRRWGGHVELQAAAHVYDVCVQVFDGRSGTSQKIGDEKDPFIALYYKGDGYMGHYDVVEDLPLPGLAEPTDFTSENIPAMEKPVKKGRSWSSTDPINDDKLATKKGWVWSSTDPSPAKLSPLSPERTTRNRFSIWSKLLRHQASPPAAIGANERPPSPPSPPPIPQEQTTEKEESNDSSPPDTVAASIRVQ
jgi:hypothetical protein